MIWVYQPIIGRTDKDYTGNRIATSVKSTIDKLRVLDYKWESNYRMPV